MQHRAIHLVPLLHAEQADAQAHKAGSFVALQGHATGSFWLTPF
jgi:hypothetical protein